MLLRWGLAMIALVAAEAASASGRRGWKSRVDSTPCVPVK